MTEVIRFSVVIPLYNKAWCVEECLASVLNQSYSPSEIIVVDDGSKDCGPKLVAEHSDPRVRLVRRSNSGPGRARNTGIALAKYPWVSFLDADDLWHPDHLRIHAEGIESNPGAGVMGSRFYASRQPNTDLANLSPVVGGARAIDYIARAGQGLGKSASGNELFFSSSVTIRRDLLCSLGGFTDAFQGEDTATWLRLALETLVIATEERTAIYRLDTGGLMDSRDDWSQERILTHPLRLELLKSLEAPHPKGRQKALRNYLRAIDANALRGALYHERPIEARALADGVGEEAVARLGTLRFLLKIPPKLAIFVVRSFKIARKWQKWVMGS
ncbi:MAG: glycosyltransferase family 2 protein [Sulfitobacter sp.]|uniref:glycosyltransferase family 2 protein n=1 Tax=Sulfitobacter sp. TaxID=1903071 RepID=UPI0032670A5E